MTDIKNVPASELIAAIACDAVRPALSRDGRDALGYGATSSLEAAIEYDRRFPVLPAPAAKAPACSMCLSTTECKMGCPGEDADEAPDAGPNADLSEIAKACGLPGDMDAPARLYEILCTVANFATDTKTLRETIAAKDAEIERRKKKVDELLDVIDVKHAAVAAHEKTTAEMAQALRQVTQDASYHLMWAVDGTGYPATAVRAVKALRDAFGSAQETHEKTTADLRAALETERKRSAEDDRRGWENVLAALGADVDESVMDAAERVVRERDALKAAADESTADRAASVKQTMEIVDGCQSAIESACHALGIEMQCGDRYSKQGPAILAAIEALRSRALVIPAEVLERHPLPWKQHGHFEWAIDDAHGHVVMNVPNDIAAAIVSAANGGAS